MLLYLNLALLELLLARATIPHAIEPGKAFPVGKARPLNHLTPKPINNPEPADIGKNCEPEQEKRDQHQARANRIERLIETRSNGRTENTAGTLRQTRVPGIIERAQGRCGNDQQQQA